MAGAQAGCLSQEGEQTMWKRPDYIYKGEASAKNTQVVQRIKNEEENKETGQELYYQNKKDKDKETWEYFEKDMRKYIN